MILAIANVLSAADMKAIRAGLANATFVDGRATAGWSARLVKSNLQASVSPEVERLRTLVETRLVEHPVFALATRPKAIIGPLFSRYRPGQAYGAHVDDALIAGVRSDVSFTLFLAEPDAYDGGELIIDTASGEEAFKLSAGSVVTYPATTLHRVAPVGRGERTVAAGWVRSYVREAARRELLFDLETARRRLFDREGKTAEGDLLAKCAANLLRQWCDD
ncbi:MAG: Fe2+-dependent dioxygenase [Hyphomonadaceae bacterium]|jgi:PKHD-type hydroxylase|nr:Fe2+-dependent dioxygenase [Hyphomonadaceae bacterium]